MNKLNIQQYLQNHTLEKITEELAIKVKRHPQYPNLVLLNYCQLDSPRTHPIVIECRCIILDEANNWSVVNYPYNRFFNYGEDGSATIDWNTASVYEKLDGTLMCLWYT